MKNCATKKVSKKRKRVKGITQTSEANNTDMEARDDTFVNSYHVSEPDVPRSTTELVQQDAPISQDSTLDVKGLKKTRGPTRMKHIAMDPGSRIHVEFTNRGEPCGKGSVTLSSYLGPLVREHVSVTLHDWRKLGDDKKMVLWKSIQARFDIDEEWQKTIVFKSMGCLWRASKSRLVKQIQLAKNEDERLELRPNNIHSMMEWKRFIKEKTSQTFKDTSSKYKEIRSKQISHTCSRKGMTRLAEDMKKNSADPSSVSRVDVWIRSRTRKDGQPVNTSVSETIEKLNKFENESPSSSINIRDDSLSKVLGQDKYGRLRGMGRGMTISKLMLFSANEKYISQMENRITQLENLIKKNNVNQSEEADKASSKDDHSDSNQVCKLVDWRGTNEIVAEGCVISIDPKELVGGIPLGPDAMKVLVDILIKPDAFLWRPTINMSLIQHAQDKIIAWPAESVILQVQQESNERDNVSPNSSNSRNKCKLIDWRRGKDELVAEGRLHSDDPNALINDIALGPNAMIVWVDVPKSPEACLWRPTSQMSLITHAINSTIAWPADKVIMESNSESEGNISSPVSVNTNNVKKCKLLDVTGSGRIVAEGRWSSSDPKQVVHFVPLGPNATSVWIDTPKIPSASLWRSTSEMEFIDDAIGSIVAWPTDKVLLV